MPGNRQIILRELPKGALTEAHFALREADRPMPGAAVTPVLSSPRQA